jgi:hypothetical protein
MMNQTIISGFRNMSLKVFFFRLIPDETFTLFLIDDDGTIDTKHIRMKIKLLFKVSLLLNHV